MNKFHAAMNRHSVLKGASMKTVCPRPTFSHLRVRMGSVPSSGLLGSA